MTGTTVRTFVGLALCTLLSAPLARGADSLVVGALGDSITAGFNAQRLGDNRDLSWSTGTATLINSHLKRVMATRGAAATAFNEAIAGSRVHDLDRQVTRLLTKSPDYVTLAIGANDVCSWSTVDHHAELADFEEHLRSQIQRLVEARPNVRIALAPIPDLYNLWEVASTKAGCQAKWDMMGICAPLLSSRSNADERTRFQSRWRDANDAVTRVANDFAGNVAHDPADADTQFEWRHVSSMDCFHPSVEGQNLLSEMTWKGF